MDACRRVMYSACSWASSSAARSRESKRAATFMNEAAHFL
ncbi:MAG: hypothetical protein A4E31_00314 [Methanomassiliicoccales archaeon PtaU1.Bin030]|nr:MAG: hypothetical protein A4E31_00314 [Methanomassiliicoccales archaeon PtaU1.Bin030]